MKLDVAVIIPALDEEEAIGEVISEITPGIVGEIVVVNNNSSDATGEIARNCGATVLDEPRQGYGFACMKGVTYLAERPKKPDIVVFLDGDHSDYPGEMNSLIDAITEKDCDLAIGCRSGSGSSKNAMPLQQRWGNRLATFLISLLYGVKFLDLGPFRAIKFDRLLELGLEDRTYGWPIEMQLKAVKRGLKICQVPVSYRKRIGKSKISGTFKGTLLAGYKIISAIIRYR